MTASPQSTSPLNYKDTLNLPQTEFKMKAGAATREPEIETFWDEQAVYQQAMAKNRNNPRFLLHDGPPYLSSDKIHIGTALNKILKDIVTRYKTQRGFYSPYVPGYDGHGLPIENAVVKSIKGGRDAITPAELRHQCRAFALKNLKGQEANFKRLGVWGHWEKPYITIDGTFEARQIELFWSMFQEGHVYKGLKPVYWCTSCETALADAEVEYGDHTSPSVYVAFTLNPDSQRKAIELFSPGVTSLSSIAMVIWTTTPWTLPANLALAVNPDLDYVLIQPEVSQSNSQHCLVVAAALLEAFASETGLAQFKELGRCRGEQLADLRAQHPFLSRESVVLTGDHVTTDAGTGVVHTAPGHGMEDYVVCQAYDRAHAESPLGILSPLNAKGVFTASEFLSDSRLIGQPHFKANAVVIEILREENALLAEKTIQHSYPHCWRCHHPVIYRATDQWFIGIERIRAEALSAISGVDWVPSRGEARITSMVEGRGDWCISRQRVWGVPIPVFYHRDTREVVINQDIITHLSSLFATHTSDIWWSWSPEKLLEGLTASQIGTEPKNLVPEMDIMDVWFDSGVTHTTVVEARKDELGSLPVELYLEGSDQHRGWFQSALLTSVMVNGKAPYKTVVTHGFVLDQDGRKMSKSLGNFVEPQSIIQEYGADVLRLWVASVDYGNDVRIGKAIIAQLVEVYKKIRNTVRYLMGNLYDFDPSADSVAYEELTPLDRYILHRLSVVIDTLGEAFDAYEFYRYYQVLQNFCVVELSSLYFDVAKDILYTHRRDSKTRRQIQTVLYLLLSHLVPLLVPVTPHLAEDIWLNLPEKHRWCEFTSAMLLPWPNVPDGYRNPILAESMGKLLAVKEAVNASLEAFRVQDQAIKSSLEAAVVFDSSTQALLLSSEMTEKTLAQFLMVSGVTWAETIAGKGLSRPITGDSQNSQGSLGWVTKASGEKCDRCWKFTAEVGSFDDHPTLCADCYHAVI